MKRLKRYWLLFKSKTPKRLRKLQIFLSALTVPIGATLAAMSQWGSDKPTLQTILSNSLIAIPFIVFTIQFATDDKALKKMANNNE